MGIKIFNNAEEFDKALQQLEEEEAKENDII